MRLSDKIIELGKQNAKTCFPKKLEDLDFALHNKVPYFNVIKNQMGKYDIECFNHYGHDNEPRMEYVTQYFKRNVFPNIDRDYNITGYYRIELHDSFSYLENNSDYKDVLSFGGVLNDKEQGIMIPDAYMMGDWGNQLQHFKDPFEWESKKQKIIWVGTTTGNRDPLKNDRINTCIWSLDKRNYCDFYITKIAQMDFKEIENKITTSITQQILRNPIDIAQQLEYRYHLTMDGNASPWNVFEYLSNSLIFKKTSNNMLWYYPLLQHEKHYVEIPNNESISKYFTYYENNKNEAKLIIQNANEIANQLFKPLTAQQYCVALFEQMAQNR